MSTDEVQRLKERIRELEGEQRHLEGAFAATFRLTTRHLKLLLLLYKVPAATSTTISQRLGVGDVKVAIYRLRRKLEEQGYKIDVESRRGVGYWLTDQSRALIKDLISAAKPSPAVAEPALAAA